MEIGPLCSNGDMKEREEMRMRARRGRFLEGVHASRGRKVRRVSRIVSPSATTQLGNGQYSDQDIPPPTAGRLGARLAEFLFAAFVAAMWPYCSDVDIG
jgi:hypothetical protein